MGSPGKFEIGDKAEKLLFSVFDLTTNRKSYPVKYRRLADFLQMTCLNIASAINKANLAKQSGAPDWRERRVVLQTTALGELENFQLVAKYSLHAGLISAATAELWSGMAHDIKYMTLAWRKSGLTS